MTCIDLNDQTQQNILNNKPGPLTNANGEYTLNQVDVFTQEFTNNILSDSQNNPVTLATSKYGADVFYDSLKAFNLTISERTVPDIYPSVKARLNSGNISAAEFADFMQQYGQNPTGVVTKTNRDYARSLFDLEDYYSKTIRTGALAALCTRFESIFGALGGFFDFLSEIGNLIFDVVDKIKAFREEYKDLTIAATVQALAVELRDRIEKEVKRIVDAVVSVLENLFNSINTLFDNTSTFVDELTIRGIMKEKDNACLMFSEKNKSLIAKTIVGAFDYALSLFENPSIAQIEFLVVRICAYLTNIEALFNDVTTPMKQFEFKYTRIANRLKTISNITTSSALRAGAIRMPPELRKKNINSIESLWEGTGGEVITPTGGTPINPKKPDVQEYLALPSCNSIKSGSNKKIAVDGPWVDDELLGMKGWTGLDPTLRVFLIRMWDIESSNFVSGSPKITVKLGWVSDEYNKINGAPENAHLSGLCVDVSTEGWDVETLEQSALKAGFRFVKSYDGYLHLDLRPLRA